MVSDYKIYGIGLFPFLPCAMLVLITKGNVYKVKMHGKYMTPLVSDEEICQLALFLELCFDILFVSYTIVRHDSGKKCCVNSNRSISLN